MSAFARFQHPAPGAGGALTSHPSTQPLITDHRPKFAFITIEFQLSYVRIVHTIRIVAFDDLVCVDSSKYLKLSSKLNWWCI